MIVCAPEFVVKSRKYINPRSWQLAREAPASRYSRRVLPDEVNGVKIFIPDICLSFGFSEIRVSSPRYPGERQIAGLYQAGKAADAIQMGVIALQALYLASVTSNPFGVWSLIYQPVRRIKAWMLARITHGLLSALDRRRFFRFLRMPGWAQGQKRLVHGNLHGGNILIDYEHRELAMVDLEMMHIGDPVIDFAALWITHYLATPALGAQFMTCVVDALPCYCEPEIMIDAQREIAIEAYLMLHRARRSGHHELLRRSQNLIKEALGCSTPAELLRY